MAVGKIPAKLNGTPIPALADVSATGSRTTNQRPVLNGEVPALVISFGPVKPKIDLTFPIVEDKQLFVRATGALLSNPTPFNLQILLGSDWYTLANGIVSDVNPTANQDADGSIKVSALFESISLDNP